MSLQAAGICGSARRDGIAVIALDDGAPVNFCRPSVDPLFSSAAQVWGSWVLGLMLTGMGADGSRGAQAIVSAGGAMIAQDETSSVVWGMPGQVAQAGICSAVLPLERDRAEALAPVRGRRMTPQDFDYLRKLLKQRSGLVLSAEKQYLAESRLLPVARKHGFAGVERIDR